ncbi:lef-4 [Cnaphalocrocis medinalis granulovirus]|uniref:Lef-4 n=1 Tax=Cnaphalocrocis medinalis granulovirus TaxID=1750712 RepID=A0A109WW77_9BBAC|nr:lef-4 [Cnaphalocrocis medinalis granulovirus]ALN42016.1 lef-4 [Cnaphalocrocis medinalis granulovirus]AMF83828.1 lef-4 [Cnaphalocrocis medinalis granulovirus]
MATTTTAITNEQEVSYTFAYSQDVLYRLKDWLDSRDAAEFHASHQQYTEIFDVNNVRTRICNGVVLSSIKKEIIDVSKFVVFVDDNFVPMIKRQCTEKCYYTECKDEIKRVLQTRVYKSKDNIEIKFEQIYYEHHVGDKLDPLYANKQIALYNIIKPNDLIDVTCNSHLGSDEILANCRLEIEYDVATNNNDTNTITTNASIFYKAAKIIRYIESVVLSDVIITPFLSHTNIFNEICYRPFVDDILFGDNSINITWWALKLNGTRGKGYLVNGKKLYIQLDDMQMFVFDLCLLSNDDNAQTKWCHNRVIGLQIEMVNDKTFYVTDILNVYKYKYNNKNQYDIGSCVTISLCDAITFMNIFAKHVYKCDHKYMLRFQSFETHKQNVNMTRELNDGYVGVNENGGLVKIKAQRTYEMKYVGNGMFVSSFGQFKCSSLSSLSSPLSTCVILETLLCESKIYEVVINIKDNTVSVIKERPDRLIPN